MTLSIKTKWIAPFLLAGIICLKALQASAQTAPKFDVKNLIATSPEAAMLGRFGDIPIGYYTGTADISIPVYSLKEAGVEIPIVLAYHGSGIKVDDQATHVGLGWSLEPGGAIIKITNGMPDALDVLPTYDGFSFLKSQSTYGLYLERYEIGDAFFTSCELSPTQNTTLIDHFPALDALHRGMGQPDIYQYNFAGYSGKFYVNPENGNIVLINPKQQDITFIASGGNWIAKTMDGNVFTFSTIENSGWNYDHYMGVTAKLTSVALHNGKTITFDYQDGTYQWFSYSESFHSEYPLLLGGSTDYAVMPTATGIDYHLKMLTKITTDKAIINFNLEDRSDLYSPTGPPPKRIASVDITDANSGKKIKTLKFNYDYFQGAVTSSYLTGNITNPSIYAEADAKRLKLTSVQETGYTPAGAPVVKPPYTFTYNEATALPIKSSFSTDFWGYYNGQINSKAIPDLSFFYMSDDADYTTMPASLLTSFTGANRTPDTAKMKAGLLTKIVYPTGGTTAFTYESNTFGNYAYPDIYKTESAQHNGYVADYNLSSDVKTLTFTLPKTEILTFNVIITKGPNPARTFAELQPSTVVLTKTTPSGTTTLNTWQIFEVDHTDFDNTGSKQWTTAITFNYDANASYTITTYLPDGLGAQGTSSDDASVSANFSYYSLPAGYKTSFGGGMRVSGIKNYTQDGQVASNKVIKYLNEDNSSSGILMSPLKPLYVRPMYAIIPNGSSELDGFRGQSKNVWFISSESSIPFSDGAQGSLVGYSRVEADDVAPDGSTNGKHVYFYNNLESESRPNLPTNARPWNGLISKEQVFSNATTTPLTETTFSYTNINTWLYSGYKVANTFVGDNTCATGAYGNDSSGLIVDNDTNNPIAVGNFEHYYRIYTYPLNSYWSMLSSKTTTENFNGQSLANTESYTYNTKGQLIQTDGQNSKQQTITQKFIYPLNNPGNAMSADLIAQNLYNSLQETITLNNNAEQSHKYISYRDFNSLAVQNDITGTYLGTAVSPAITDATFDVYGPNKTIRQVTQKGLTTVLVWAFNNSFPIAEIKNTTNATVQTVLGGQSAVDAFGLTSPGKTAIDAFLAPLRSSTSLSTAQITTFVIDPLIGMTSSTDARGLITIYEYDNYQRLMNIKDKDGNIIKHIEYHYQGQ